MTSNIIEALVSVTRLSAFLASEELQTTARKVIIPTTEPTQGTEVLSLKACDFTWDPSAPTPALSEITLSVHSGELVGILGRVGCGKSSLLSAIIGEMVRVDGECVVGGVVAYAPQDPWIQSASVRDNICFGHAFEEEYYELVLEGVSSSLFLC